MRIAELSAGTFLFLLLAVGPAFGQLPPAAGNWPEFEGTDRPAAPPPARPGSWPSPTAEALRRFEPAETVAQIGDQFILKGELQGDANLLLSGEFQKIERFPPEEQQKARSALLAQREQIMEQLLQLAIDRKLMYLEYKRSMKKAPDEKKEQEMVREITKRVNAYFTTQLTEVAAKVRTAPPEKYADFIRQNYQLFRIALVMKDAGIESPDDPRLDRLLRENGTSLQSQQQAFMERALGQSAVGRNLQVNQEVTHDQMLSYYHDHPEEFQIPNRARWEQLSVLFKRFPSKFEAGQAIADMGNLVYLGGAPLDAVAKKHSQEKNAERGGYHDWTTFGDLSISREINEAVFSLPLNELSGIIEDDDGLHIVRILEREDAHFTPFTEAQVSIKETLADEFRNKAYKDYISQLRERTPVWTIYDELPSARANRPAGFDR